MFYDFKIKLEIAHVKLISKSLDILKSISKGELTRIQSLFQENKNSYTENKKDLPEIFDIRMTSLVHFLSDMQYKHFNNKTLNVLQLGDFGFLLVNIKQKFIDTGIIMKNKRLVYIEVKLSTQELNLIRTATSLYYNILLGNFDCVENVINFNVDESFKQDLINAGFLATNLLDHKIKLNIQDKIINRKAKWAYDIVVAIDNIDKQDIIKNVGTLPKVKITKNAKI